MNAALKAVTVPRLRKLGFTGSFPHLRRVRGDCVDLVVFQFNKYAGSFVVEIAFLTAEEAKSHWSGARKLAGATVYDAKKRYRLGAAQGHDHWVVFGKQNDEPNHEVVEPPYVYERIASHAADLIEGEGTSWWSGPLKKHLPTD